MFYAENGWENFWNKIGDFFIEVDDSGMNYLTRILLAIALIVIAWLLLRLISSIYKKATGIKKKQLGIDVSAKFFILNVLKIFYWLAIAFTAISILKINITGIAGIASAVTVALGLALQDVISCFASGLIVLNSKNISTGDYISVQCSYGSAEGTVLKVHLFFTHLGTPNGQEVVIPNSNILHAVITNYTKLKARRLNFDVGVSYDTDIELAKSTLNDLVKDDKLVLKDKELSIYVYELGAYSVGLRIRCWTKIKDYWPLYNSLPEKVLLAFREKGINIPSSTDLKVSK